MTCFSLRKLMPDIYLGLGSNVGDRLHQLRSALHKLSRLGELKAISSVYESPAWGITTQADFLNMAAILTTDAPPEDVITTLRRIEQELGRQPREKWGPREIDIDIVFWDEQVISTPQLGIPHPHWHERAFVIVPLAEIAPGFIPPGHKQTLAQIAATLKQPKLRTVARLEKAELQLRPENRTDNPGEF